MSGSIRLIARREIVTRIAQRGYRIGLGIALLVVIAACVLPSLFGGGSSPSKYDIAVATDVPGLPAALQAVARAEGVQVTTHQASSAAQARREVAKGSADAAVLPGGKLVAKNSGDAVVRVVQNAYQVAETVDRLRNAGLSTAAVKQALNVEPLQVTSSGSKESAQRQTIAIIAVVALFTQLVTFCTWVAMGVVEEKASRVVELVLSSVRPMQLLTGKLLGIGVLATAQVLLVGVVALVASTVAGTLTVPASAIATVAVSFVGFVLGFLFFGALAAGLGSTVSRQEEVSGILTPVTLSLTVCYGASFATARIPDSTFARVVSIVPPFSVISMPARIARGGVPVLDIVLAVVLLIAAAAAIIALAARVYRASVLHSGTRVSLRRAWRGEAVSDLS